MLKDDPAFFTQRSNPIVVPRVRARRVDTIDDASPLPLLSTVRFSKTPAAAKEFSDLFSLKTPSSFSGHAAKPQHCECFAECRSAVRQSAVHRDMKLLRFSDRELVVAKTAGQSRIALYPAFFQKPLNNVVAISAAEVLRFDNCTGSRAVESEKPENL